MSLVSSRRPISQMYLAQTADNMEEVCIKEVRIKAKRGLTIQTVCYSSSDAEGGVIWAWFKQAPACLSAFVYMDKIWSKCEHDTPYSLSPRRPQRGRLSFPPTRRLWHMSPLDLGFISPSHTVSVIGWNVCAARNRSSSRTPWYQRCQRESTQNSRIEIQTQYSVL